MDSVITAVDISRIYDDGSVGVTSVSVSVEGLNDKNDTVRIQQGNDLLHLSPKEVELIAKSVAEIMTKLKLADIPSNKDSKTEKKGNG